MSFNGFTAETLKYLIEVKMNNSKEYYEANRDVYKKYVLYPFQELVMSLSECMLDIDPLFEVTPAVNKTISRMYRDTRFSKDKSLYRNNVWITFKRPKRELTDTPEFFFEIFPDWYRYGMGYYSATRDSMDTFREFIDEKPGKFMSAIKSINQDIFSIEGDRYKRDIKTMPPLINEWYNRKNLYVVHNCRDINKVFSPDITYELIDGFKSLAALYRYLCEVEEKKTRERAF